MRQTIDKLKQNKQQSHHQLLQLNELPTQKHFFLTDIIPLIIPKRSIRQD